MFPKLSSVLVVLSCILVCVTSAAIDQSCPFGKAISVEEAQGAVNAYINGLPGDQQIK